ncbi:MULTISPECIES: hybrid sensor histidine kinase/response regulator [Cyanophyceae]|uniref:hybrid sensor histidine kinase/response regulator n=1 Tax=Cyanophyceae TaxID=3028117 RepID=UPI00232FC39F|nr:MULTISPECIES: ATP-binding protein [Cyanophyceae]MDB9358503.1 ATP-binding protein [Nodularia spumigena CS-587/03]MDB9341923.1 ATP-binding protein [Nodularia spumigena CS-589/07]MDB9398510.1 ATP-binding protein [Microcystis aeruginosa CS-567/02-A1]MDB9498936.1 ATP-binding protein [Nodularia spumigena CS-336/02]MDB9534008.1 ATP-binding protein [Nodularia spumigena CS-1038]
MDQVRILVVEDEVIVARTIANQLNQLGYTVTGKASSGEVAIAKALETKPQLMLMDIILKGNMDGITAAASIREQLDIPVIFLTAYGDDKTLQRAKLTQPFGYVVKPFTSKDLRIAVEIGLLKHQLEQDLRENRDKLATLLNSMSDAVIATDDQAKVTFMNPAAESLTGWKQADAQGKDITIIFNIVDEITEAALENPVLKVLRDHKVVYLGEFTSLITKDGKKVPIGDSASPIMRRPNQIDGVVVVFWDLSERRQREFLERALNQERELNHLKSLFISTVSHDFRNPLTVIQTAVELIEIQGDSLTATKKTTYLKRIKGAVESMKQLMEDVLFMGKSDVGKVECHPHIMNLEQLCREVIAEFSLVTNGGHEIILTCHSKCTDALIDEKLLHYILINLLSNAVKYSPQNQNIHVDLTCDYREQIVILRVKDQGIGIPEVDQKRLFESFYRASNVQSIQGTGLGLVIVKRCVEAHQGEISFTSQVGVGTTFTVILPLNYSVAHHPQQA